MILMNMSYTVGQVRNMKYKLQIYILSSYLEMQVISREQQEQNYLHVGILFTNWNIQR